MNHRRHRPRIALIAFGGLTALIGSTITGGPFTGYGLKTYLIHVGVFAMVAATFSTVLTWAGSDTDRRRVLTVSLALGCLCPISVRLLSAGLTPSPYFPVEPSVIGQVVDRFGVTLTLVPLAAGYVLGTVERSRAAGREGQFPPQPRRSRTDDISAVRHQVGRPWNSLGIRRVALAAALLGPLIGYLIIVAGSGGENLGWPFVYYWVVLFAGGVGAIPFYLVARWEGR